jgi:membrane fusion protein, copper/silver efflux system
MKTPLLKYAAFLLAGITISFSSCNNASDRQSAAEKGTAPQPFQEQFSTMLTEYFELKDALVQTDAATASAQAGEFRAALERTDEATLEDGNRQEWVSRKREMDQAATTIQQSSDVEQQRTAFQTISNRLIESVQTYGTGTQQTVYQQFCPMAFNDTGAAWLAQEKKIANPYFGDRMLRCGEVQREF